MSAEIVRRIILEETLVVRSPLRICSGYTDNITDMLVLKNKKGKAFIPGTSLAGVLRDEIESLYNSPEAADVFFGYIKKDKKQGADDITKSENQSTIVIDDVELEDDEIIGRDGVGIAAFAGTACETKKFDYEAVERGAKGVLRIEVTIRDFHIKNENIPQISYRHKCYEEDGDFYGEITASIADMLTNGINVGSLTTKGFGKVATQDPCSWIAFDFTEGKDADAWLTYLMTGSMPKPDAKNKYTSVANDVQYAIDDLVIEADFALCSSLLVRDGNQDPDKSNVAVQMKSKDDYLIPGTTIKGVLRNHGEKILLNLCRGAEKPRKEFINSFMGYTKKRNGAGPAESQRSKLFVDEVYIGKDVVQKQEQTRIRIDRFTGGTMKTSLFTEEPVWRIKNNGVPVIKMRLRVCECTKPQAGLMLLLLREMWMGNISFGGGKSIGRGVLEGIYAEIHYKGKHHSLLREHESLKIEGDKNLLEGYVGALKEYVKTLEGEVDG